MRSVYTDNVITTQAVNLNSSRDGDDGGTIGGNSTLSVKRDLWKAAKRKSISVAAIKNGSSTRKEFKGNHAYALERNSLKLEQRRMKRLEKLIAAAHTRQSSLSVVDNQTDHSEVYKNLEIPETEDILKTCKNYKF